MSVGLLTLAYVAETSIVFNLAYSEFKTRNTIQNIKNQFSVFIAQIADLNKIFTAETSVAGDLITKAAELKNKIDFITDKIDYLVNEKVATKEERNRPVAFDPKDVLLCKHTNVVLIDHFTKKKIDHLHQQDIEDSDTTDILSIKVLNNKGSEFRRMTNWLNSTLSGDSRRVSFKIIAFNALFIFYATFIDFYFTSANNSLPDIFKAFNTILFLLLAIGTIYPLYASFLNKKLHQVLFTISQDIALTIQECLTEKAVLTIVIPRISPNADTSKISE